MHVTLDGFVCGPNGEQDWMTMSDGKMDKYLIKDLLSTVDTMLVGRVLYEGFASFWPTVHQNPESPKELVEFANWMAQTPKIVFSKTLSKVGWTNSSLASGDPTDTIQKLKSQPGGDMVIFGGARIIQYLTQHNLVDEYRIKLEPVVIGKGKPLFKDVDERMNLHLIQAKTFDSGVVVLYYESKKN